MNNKKLKARDFVTTGIFSILFIMIFFVCVMCMSFIPYTQPFGLALTALVAGPVYMIMRAKVAKPGGIMLFGAVYALVMFGTGGGWAIPVAAVAGAIAAELISCAGKYRNFKLNTIGYAVMMVAVAAGSYIPLLTMKEYYLELAAGNGVENDLMTQIVEFISVPYLACALAATAVCAVLGAVIAKGMFKKHFIKAGIIKEVN
ncbi:energy-coupling factor transport system substrate-specific component [Ruminiclostridium sufflavum DSM 19573]|uniref:Energy-coupling factor transport system substrate-specific component n=1 Tax=Ruminiclostridium sufflavum DSM 19573 TaxID=1121337 RepID=A0A318YAY6_9FIRM|nr:MptD family putative ECF transporter S component [Ruminiclostridium sufflavum]PYG89741.1 energy-coupling factor transport system substrate-specific component [Ruminiclostridium sufflavum DSM 19573]